MIDRQKTAPGEETNRNLWEKVPSWMRVAAGTAVLGVLPLVSVGVSSGKV